MKNESKNVKEYADKLVTYRRRLDLGYFQNEAERVKLQEEMMALIVLTPPNLQQEVLKELAKYPSDVYATSVAKSFMEKKEQDRMMEMITARQKELQKANKGNE
jgi:tryptophan synthase alpha subunit